MDVFRALLCVLLLPQLALAQETPCLKSQDTISVSRTFRKQQAQKYLDAYDYEMELVWARTGSLLPSYMPALYKATIELNAYMYNDTIREPVIVPLTGKFQTASDNVNRFTERKRIKIPVEAINTTQGYPQIGFQVFNLDNKLSLGGHERLKLAGSILQRQRKLLLGTDYIKGLGIENDPAAFPVFFSGMGTTNGEILVTMDRGYTAGVLVIHRRLKNPEWYVKKLASLSIGQPAALPDSRVVTIVNVKPEAGIVFVEDPVFKDVRPYDVLEVEPIKNVQSFGEYTVGQKVQWIGNGTLSSGYPREVEVLAISANGMIGTTSGFRKGEISYDYSEFYQPVFKASRYCKEKQ